MSTSNIGSIAAKVFDIVSSLEKVDQLRVFKAVHALCNISDTSLIDEGQNKHTPRADSTSSVKEQSLTPASYLAQKSPKSKIEHLAVAARYREKYEYKSEHNKEDFIAFFSSARKNFDHSNFPTDMRNAKNAGFFVKESTVSHSHRLTYGGQNYVDTLPDAAKAMPLLKKTNQKKKTKQKTT